MPYIPAICQVRREFIGWAWPMIVLLISLGSAGAEERARDFLHKPDDWFRTPAGRTTLDNILSFQSPAASWPKNTDCVSAPYAGEPGKLHGTFDNAATTDELRLLARSWNVTRTRRDREAFLRGLDHILSAQYPTGGWPQYFPPGDGYARYITFNDDTMVRLMTLLREVATADGYQFVDSARRERAGAAFDRGIDCIVRCQVRIDDRLTVWCAQHDAVDWQPRPARTFELASLSGSESTRIVRLLMSLDRPSPAVVTAIDAAVVWFDHATLTGIRQDYQPDPQAPKGENKIIVADPAAPPLWARFYDLATEKPIFVDRDGVPRAQLADIGYERRNGYAWLGTWPQKLLDDEYPAWCQRHGHTPVISAKVEAR